MSEYQELYQISTILLCNNTIMWITHYHGLFQEWDSVTGALGTLFDFIGNYVYWISVKMLF